MEQDWFDIHEWSKKKGYDSGNREKPKAIAHVPHSRRHYLITKRHHLAPLGIAPEIRKKRADHIRKAGCPTFEEISVRSCRATPSGTFEPKAWIGQSAGP